MGVQQSRQTNGSSQNGGGARKDEHQDCVPCFFLGSFSKHLPGRASDPIGTPLPETPLFQRKRRQQAVKAAMQKDDPVFSSKYGGLEKETATMFPPQNSMNRAKFQEEPEEEVADPEGAQVHEGPNCENEMHAKYQLMEVLGVGSTSTVHRCVRKTTDEHFACKIIDCQLIEERFQGMMQQFQTEIEALRQLKHPGIIRLYDVYITGERIFIVMELMEGGELFDYVVQKGTLTEEEASRIVRMVTSAMVYMHSMNIIHRDLKPENLLLKSTPKGAQDEIEVKIIDFGLSKVRSMLLIRRLLPELVCTISPMCSRLTFRFCSILYLYLSRTY
jgi:tRNA A-37 threonylcarbamoyl transferase component Bud32